jgi:hypothetical protein
MHRVGLISPPAMESLMGDAGGVANPAPTVTSGPGGGDRRCELRLSLSDTDRRSARLVEYVIGDPESRRPACRLATSRRPLLRCNQGQRFAQREEL